MYPNWLRLFAVGWMAQASVRLWADERAPSGARSSVTPSVVGLGRWRACGLGQ